MKTGFALLLLTAGGLLVYSAFRTPPDPRIVFGNLLAGRPLGSGVSPQEGLGGPLTGDQSSGGGAGGGGGAW